MCEQRPAQICFRATTRAPPSHFGTLYTSIHTHITYTNTHTRIGRKYLPAAALSARTLPSYFPQTPKPPPQTTYILWAVGNHA